MSWIDWFKRRPLLQAEIEDTSKDDDNHTKTSSPSAPLTTAQGASSHAASPVGRSLPAAEQATQKLDIQCQDGVKVGPTAITDSIVIGTDLDEFDAVSGRVAEIEASAETVEEALAVAHTVFSETCGVVANGENGIASSSCEVIEPLSSNSEGRPGLRDERASSHFDAQGPVENGFQIKDTTVNASIVHDYMPCQALVPCSDSGDTEKNFVCLLDLHALEEQHLDVIKQALGPGLPSLEELLSYTQPHDILGVRTDADKETLKKAYRDRARTFHPDKHRSADRDVDRAFTQAFMLITRAYMTLVSGDAQPDRLQILNKVDLRRDRPVVGWALQQKHDEKKREKLSRAEKNFLDARKEVASAQQACAQHEDQATSKESRALQRRLTRAKLALTKAEATVQAEGELYQIEQQKDRERVMKRLQKEERQKEERANSQKQIPKKRSREHQQIPTDIIEEAARLEAQAAELRERAAFLRAQATQSSQGTETGDGQGPDALQGMRSGKRRLVIQGCSSGKSKAKRT